MRRREWRLMPAARFEEYSTQWDELNSRGAGSVLLDSRLIRCAIAHFGDDRMRLAVLPDGAGLRAAALLTSRSPLSYQTFQPSQAPLGSWLQAPGERITDLADSLHRALPAGCLVLSITQQDPDIVERPNPNDRVVVSDYIETARITIAGEWGAYWAARGQNLRHNMKRARKKLAQAGLEARVETATTPEDIDRAVETYGDIESRSWKAEHGTAVTRDNLQGRFYRALLKSFAASGDGCVQRLALSGSTGAVDLCIGNARETVILKTTYDIDFGEYSPAFLMREIAFQKLFESSQGRRIEFYGRLMEWHRRWSDEVRTMYHVTHFRWPWVRRLNELRRRPSLDKATSIEGSES